MESEGEQTPAVGCSTCGGYYPGDCKCAPCHGSPEGGRCDSCEVGDAVLCYQHDVGPVGKSMDEDGNYYCEECDGLGE